LPQERPFFCKRKRLNDSIMKYPLRGTPPVRDASEWLFYQKARFWQETLCLGTGKYVQNSSYFGDLK
jgi:hypothetical protein